MRDRSEQLSEADIPVCLPLRRQVRFSSFNPVDEIAIGRRHLPHWRQSGTAYFVTFRLADSLPQPILRQWRDERATWLRVHPQPWLENERLEYEKRFGTRMQQWLDAGWGACYLRSANVRAEFERSLLRFDGTRYDVDSFIVMPNHIHLVISAAARFDLSSSLQGIKGASAHGCNKLLGRRGKFWKDESYEHIIRDPRELAAFRDYIRANPQKACLLRHEYSLQLRNVLVAQGG